MSLNFFDPACETKSSRKVFGLCDDPPPEKYPAYIDEVNGSKWIAVVVNDPGFSVSFIAIDNCIEIKRKDGKMAKRCDGLLKYETTVIFIELKQRKGLGSGWVKDGEQQVRTTISYFEETEDAKEFSQKKAYICNSEHPRFREFSANRMERFLGETGYVLRIENRIRL